MHLLSQILILVHIMLLSRDITLLSLFFPEVRWCLHGINEEKLGWSHIRGGQPGLGGIQTPGCGQEAVTVTGQGGTGNTSQTAPSISPVRGHLSDAAPLITVLFVDQKVLYLQIKTQAGHDFLTPWYCLMNSYGLSAVLGVLIICRKQTCRRKLYRRKINRQRL